MSASRRRVLYALAVWCARTGHPPTLRELAAMARLRSREGVRKHLDAAQAAGLVERREGYHGARDRVLTMAGVRALGGA